MFDVGFWEILLILVLALVIIGPERLPGAARQAGYFVRKARRYIEGVRTEVESELDVNEFKRILHNQEIQISELKQQIQTGVDDVKSDIPSADFLTDVPSHQFSEESPAKAVSEASDEMGSDKNKEDLKSGSDDESASATSSSKS